MESWDLKQPEGQGQQLQMLDNEARSIAEAGFIAVSERTQTVIKRAKLIVVGEGRPGHAR